MYVIGCLTFVEKRLGGWRPPPPARLGLSWKHEVLVRGQRVRTSNLRPAVDAHGSCCLVLRLLRVLFFKTSSGIYVRPVVSGLLQSSGWGGGGGGVGWPV